MPRSKKVGGKRTAGKRVATKAKTPHKRVQLPHIVAMEHSAAGIRFFRYEPIVVEILGAKGPA